MINCRVISPKETKIYSNLLSVSLPAFFGQMQILPGHVEAFVALADGEVIIESSKRKKINIKIPKAECHIKEDNLDIIL